MTITQKEQYLKSVLQTLNDKRLTKLDCVTEVRWTPYDYKKDPAPNESSENWDTFAPDQTWGGSDLHFCFDCNFVTPQEAQDKYLVLQLDTGADDIWNTDNPQIFVYVDGTLTCTMDMNHHQVLLSKQAQAGKCYNIRFYAYSNYSSQTNFFHLSPYVVDTVIQDAYYDFKVPFELAQLLPDDDDRKILLFDILLNTAIKMDLRNGQENIHQSIQDACKFLQDELDQHRSQPICDVYSIGHTHIDVAWKWPLRQTREKASRSFLTVLSLMNEYPEYIFMSSQPQLYQFVKEDRPELFEQIKKRVAEGRWETEGAMWLEADCNLSSGESLIRHILHGKRFFADEFGCSENVILWLPDVFGYSAALPQILKKSGIKYFMTTKLGWNDTNKFPYDTFCWEGIDGSSVLSHLITTKNYLPYPQELTNQNHSTTYNGLENASQLMGTWQRYQNKDLSKKVLTCYGYGDGGGGTTPEMIEQGKRLQKGILNFPRARFSTVRNFFEDLESEIAQKDVPTWCGELYLEYHRGTYTSMAFVKQKNRSCEFLLQRTETIAAIAKLLANAQYPAEQLDKAWKLLLLNQFHDILPGSSIADVYQDCAIDYAKIEQLCLTVQDSSFAALSPVCQFTPTQPEQANCVLLFNPNSFVSDLTFALDGVDWEPVGASVLQPTSDGKLMCMVPQVPAKGFAKVMLNKTQRDVPVVSDTQAERIAIDTDFYEAEVASDGTLIRLYDKQHKRELFAPQQPGNCMRIFDDRPYEFDAWNIDAGYCLKSFGVKPVRSARLLESGSYRQVIEVCTAYRDSTICQKIIFYKNKRRIDFDTTIDWHEHQHLLKVEFPFQIFARKVVADIQFGNVERSTHHNTSWEQAQFEMCAHKWVDCSENGYGAALLNDCKYGYSAHGSTVSLTLLKSGIFPDPNADIGQHHFTYSLYPHTGDFREGHVIEQAYQLNCKPVCVFGTSTDTPIDMPYLSISDANIICETIKLAENGEGLILRMYEAYGRQTSAVWSYGNTAQRAFECDMMENKMCELPQTHDGFNATFMPYEIKTFLLVL